MLKYITAIVIILMSFEIFSQAEPFKVPPIIPNEKGSIVTEYKDGGARWKADWEADIYVENGETKFKLVFNAKGVTSPFTFESTWRSVAIWKAENEFYPLESETTIKNLSGNVVMIDKKKFNHKKNTAVFEREDFQLDTYKRTHYDITSDTLIVEGIVYALRTLPFSTDTKVKAKILSNEPELYNVEFHQRGIEKIKTTDGEVDCYKVEVVPKLGVLGVFKVFFPKTYFWFTVDAPHRWIRYEGLENGIGTPEVIMNVTNY
ncbi:MAG: hypothetical protein DHS20C13_26020 [Thermodesulfobacteriota bacterium]|nr:MAG: hypothetical protein DHS20C13_26020 [Thermodesulfobacteriota bacterium]